MIILTADTVGEPIRMVLQKDEHLINDVVIDAKNRHAEQLVVSVEGFLGKNNFSYSSINCLSITNGPGSFIGLKVSMAFAKALRCVLPNLKIILNSVFQILSFGQDYDFVILEADANGLYLNDKKLGNSYVKKTELPDFIDKNSKIITNSNNVVDFLKSSNTLLVQMNASGIAELNHFRCVNDEFGMGEIKPIYIREPQINLKRR